MAFLYKRSRSPYWWIKWRDERGEIQRESLGLRIGVGSETKRAREIRAQRTLEEAKAAATVSRRGDTQDMIVWVPEWFRVRYSNSPLTLTKYLQSWHAISVFFEDRRIKRAEQVRREDVISFVEWRQQPTNGGMRAASRNTALHDLKVASDSLRGVAPWLGKSECRRPTGTQTWQVAREVGFYPGTNRSDSQEAE
jgi:hypothetical protein